jgi:hypothetical protein
MRLGKENSLMKTKLPRTLCLALAVTLLVLATNQAKATIIWKLRAVNNTGMAAHDLDIALSSDIDDLVILSSTNTHFKPPQFDSGVFISWDDPGLNKGGDILMQFKGSPALGLLSAEWTFRNQADALLSCCPTAPFLAKASRLGSKNTS